MSIFHGASWPPSGRILDRMSPSVDSWPGGSRLVTFVGGLSALACSLMDNKDAPNNGKTRKKSANDTVDMNNARVSFEELTHDLTLINYQSDRATQAYLDANEDYDKRGRRLEKLALTKLAEICDPSENQRSWTLPISLSVISRIPYGERR